MDRRSAVQQALGFDVPVEMYRWKNGLHYSRPVAGKHKLIGKLVLDQISKDLSNSTEGLSWKEPLGELLRLARIARCLMEELVSKDYNSRQERSYRRALQALRERLDSLLLRLPICSMGSSPPKRQRCSIQQLEEFLKLPSCILNTLGEVTKTC